MKLGNFKDEFVHFRNINVKFCPKQSQQRTQVAVSTNGIVQLLNENRGNLISLVKLNLEFILLSKPCCPRCPCCIHGWYNSDWVWSLSHSWLIMIIDNIPAWQTNDELHGARCTFTMVPARWRAYTMQTHCSPMQRPRGGNAGVYNQQWLAVVTRARRTCIATCRKVLQLSLYPLLHFAFHNKTWIRFDQSGVPNPNQLAKHSTRILHATTTRRKSLHHLLRGTIIGILLQSV